MAFDRTNNRLLLHLLATTWIAAIAGAVFGTLPALGWSSGVGMIPYAIAWGGVFGLIPVGIAAVVMAESTKVRTLNRWWSAAWFGIALVMGTGFYWVCLISATI